MLGVIAVIPDAGVKSVGQEDNGPLTELLLQQVCVELCLLPSHSHILTGSLGFHHRQRLSVGSEQNIIRIAYLGFVGHSRQFIFIEPVYPQLPACINEHGVYVDLAGGVLGNIQGFGNIGLGLLLAFLRQFFLQSFVLCNQLLNIHIQVWLGRSSILFLGQ